MGRNAGGWKLRWRGGVAYVRFTHDGQPFSLSTGDRDPGAAGATAARIYAEVVSGSLRRRSVAPALASRTELGPVTAQWIADTEAEVSARTAQEYEWICRAQWLSRWKTLGEMTPEAIGDYQNQRLREVTRSTVRHHRAALRSFIDWAIGHRMLPAEFALPSLKRKAKGTRARAKVARRPIEPREIAKVIRCLPERGTSSPRHAPFRVRDWAIVAWETGLRPVTIARLEARDFLRSSGQLVIREEIDKIGWGRTVPLTKRARAVLERVTPAGGLVFGSHDYREHLEAAGRKAIGRPVLPYDFRHSRITSWLRAGKDVLGVQFLVGHLDLSTTAVYAHANEAAARKVVA